MQMASTTLLLEGKDACNNSMHTVDYGCGALNVGGGLHEISCCAIFFKVPAYCVRVCQRDLCNDDGGGGGGGVVHSIKA